MSVLVLLVTNLGHLSIEISGFPFSMKKTPQKRFSACTAKCGQHFFRLPIQISITILCNGLDAKYSACEVFFEYQVAILIRDTSVLFQPLV